MAKALEICHEEQERLRRVIAKLQTENKRLKGRIINLEKDRNSYKRDGKKYLEMLKDKKICPDCGAVDTVCDCPFG